MLLEWRYGNNKYYYYYYFGYLFFAHCLVKNGEDVVMPSKDLI